MSESVVPFGFEPLFLEEPFTARIGPLYTKRDANGYRLGFFAEQSHLNVEGVVHGGMLATVSDQTIGINLAHAREQRTDVLTLHLSVDFIGPAYAGDWVEATTTLSKDQGRIRFGQCELKVQDRLVLKASAVFTALRSQLVTTTPKV